MKKIKVVSFLLTLCLLMQTLTVPTLAAQTTEPSELPVPGIQEEEIPFGMVCVKKGCRTIEGMNPLAGSDRKLETAQAAFLYERNTQTVIYSYNPDTKISPGSLAKLVNAAVVMENCDLDDVVTVTGEIHRRPAGSIHAGLKTDEQITVRDLLHCMLMNPANDAAIALAVEAGGNRQAFVTMMNQWVLRIGCTGTSFGSVHGLDDDSRTTARDMVKIMMAAQENPELREILGALDYEVPATNKNAAHSFRTTNYMIDKGIIEDFYDKRVTGGIASYVDAYGASLVISMLSDDETMDYVGVVLGCERTFASNGWQPIVYGNFNEMTTLLKLGFNNYKVNRIVYDGMAMSQFTVAGGECNVLGEARVNIDSVVPINANMNNLYMNYSIVGGGLTAPVEKDSLIATVQVKYLDSVMAEAEVYAMGGVRSAANSGLTIHSTALPERGEASGVLSVIGTICVLALGLVGGYLAYNSYMRSRMRARRRRRRADRRRNY